MSCANIWIKDNRIFCVNIAVEHWRSAQVICGMITNTGAVQIENTGNVHRKQKKVTDILAMTIIN